MPKRLRSGVLLALACLTLGCAGTTSVFQPAHVAPTGHVQAEAGLDVVVPTGTLSQAIDAGKTLDKASQSRALTADEQRQVFGAGVALLLNPPSVLQHFGITYVPWARLELGIRYTSSAWRGAVRWQFLDQSEHGIDLSAGLGVQRFVYEFPVGDIVDILKVDNYTRWSVDVPVLAGQHGTWYRWWVGPRFIYSTFSAGLKLTLPNEDPHSATVEGSGVYLGGVAGVAVGYRWIFFAFETSVTQLMSKAHMRIDGNTRDQDIDSLVVVPGIALMAEF